jgi:hypothetical protein
VQPKSGEAKKKGGGGKFTWGAMLTDMTAEPKALDRNDPNYDSDEDAIVQEVAMSGDEDEDRFDNNLLYHSSSRIVQAVENLKAEVSAPRPSLFWHWTPVCCLEGCASSKNGTRAH